MVLSGAYNLGDELILRSEIDLFQKQFPNAHFHIATYNKDSFIGNKRNIHFLSFFPNNFKNNFFKNIWYFFKNIYITWKSDIVIIGGGGIFFDNEPWISFKKNLLEWQIRLFFARIFRKQVIFLGISVEVKNEDNQKKLAKIFRKNDKIFPRDERSTQILQKFGVSAEAMYDSVFLWTWKTPQEKTNKKWKIGISLRPGFLSKNDVEVMSKLCRSLSKNDVEVIFLSHSLSSSESHNDEIFVKKNIGEDCRITMSMQETLECYNYLDIVISMRLHSTILAAQFGIPAIMIPYWRKTISIGEQLWILEYAIFPENFSEEKFLEQISYVQNNYKKMQDEISANYSQIHTNFLQKINKTDILSV